jgi:hypothetical protein
MVDFVHAEGRGIGIILKDPNLFGGRDAIQRSIYCNRRPVFEYPMTLVDDGRLDFDFVSDRGMTALHAATFQTNNTTFIRELL